MQLGSTKGVFEMKLSEKLLAVVNERRLLSHPFYTAWAEGTLPMTGLAEYSRQYFQHVSRFPRYISAIHSRCPEIEARKRLLQNLADEEIHGVDHPELWMRFAEGMGASRDAVANEEQLPETKEMVEKFFELTSREWTQGLCALYAYEQQVPEVSESKIDGLKKFYGVTDNRTLSFFNAHMKYDVEHSKKVAELIDAHADPESAE